MSFSMIAFYTDQLDLDGTARQVTAAADDMVRPVSAGVHNLPPVLKITGLVDVIESASITTQLTISRYAALKTCARHAYE